MCLLEDFLESNPVNNLMSQVKPKARHLSTSRRKPRQSVPPMHIPVKRLAAMQMPQ